MSKEEIKALAHRGIELERRVAEVFAKEGWECKSDPSAWTGFDITLRKDDHIYGYVETYICDKQNPHFFAHFMKNKMQHIQQHLDELKPELFILTDGMSYEIYFNCKYAMTTTVPIGYHEYKTLCRLSAYSKFWEEK